MINHAVGFQRFESEIADNGTESGIRCDRNSIQRLCEIDYAATA
jgi:hypothetical protein